MNGRGPGDTSTKHARGQTQEGAAASESEMVRRDGGMDGWMDEQMQ